MRYFIVFTVCFLFLMVCRAPAQSAQENQCLFSELPENQNATEDMTIYQDTTLRVAILFVQFADWQTNIDARGSVGWSHFDPNDPQTYHLQQIPLPSFLGDVFYSISPKN